MLGLVLHMDDNELLTMGSIVVQLDSHDALVMQKIANPMDASKRWLVAVLALKRRSLLDRIDLVCAFANAVPILRTMNNVFRNIHRPMANYTDTGDRLESMDDLVVSQTLPLLNHIFVVRTVCIQPGMEYRASSVGCVD